MVRSSAISARTTWQPRGHARMAMATAQWPSATLALALAIAALLVSATPALAHGVSAADRAFMEQGGLMAFLYLGAKHMVTGFDHLLFLFGVIFFLYRMKDVALYVTLFAVGHSVTLLYGVLSGRHVDAYLVDAIIGFSVVYKALDNLGAFRVWFGVQPDTKSCGARLRAHPWLRPGHQAAGLRAAARGPRAEDRGLQRRGRAWPAAGARRHPAGHGLLAAHGSLLPAGVCSPTSS